MGMSASQARFTSLTARKSDIEYAGQQINQERTTLATESGTINSQLYAMSVPTPPVSTDYSKTVYSFNSNGHTETIQAMLYNDGSKSGTAGTYDIYATYDTTGSAAVSGAISCSKDTNGNYSVGSGGSPIDPVDYTFTDTDGDGKDDNSGLSSSEIATTQSNLQSIYGDGYDGNYQSSDKAKPNYVDPNGPDAGLTGPVQYYSYETAGQTRYFEKTEMDTAIANKENATYYYVDDNATMTKDETIKNATVTWDDSGRMSALTTEDGTKYTVSTATQTDDASYNDAYNEYQYQQSEYDNQISNINAKLCSLQAQDKSLELKLKQLDTDHNAVQTEIDAVKKVIDKNVEAGFKTFG